MKHQVFISDWNFLIHVRSSKGSRIDGLAACRLVDQLCTWQAEKANYYQVVLVDFFHSLQNVHIVTCEVWS